MEAEGIVAGGTPLQSAERSSATGLQEMVDASGISLRLWRLYAQAWLVCLLFPVLTLIQLRPPPLHLLLACVGLAIFVASYTRIMWRHPIRALSRSREKGTVGRTTPMRSSTPSTKPPNMVVAAWSSFLPGGTGSAGRSWFGPLCAFSVSARRARFSY